MTRRTTHALAVAAVLTSCACTTPAPPPPLLSAPASTPSPADASSSEGALADTGASPGRRERVAARLSDYFAKFVDSSSFEFLRDFWAPRAESFVTMKDADVAAIIAESRRFFRDKRAVRYEPELGTLTIRGDGDRTRADLVVKMRWCRGLATPSSVAAYGRGDYLECSTDEPMIAYHARVEITVTLDASDKLAAYVERNVLRDRYVVVEYPLEAYAAPPFGWATGEPSMVLAKGTVVLDLGESVVVNEGIKGPAVGRKVRYRGADVWAAEWAACSVPNPAGGTSAGQCFSLEKVVN